MGNVEGEITAKEKPSMFVLRIGGMAFGFRGQSWQGLAELIMGPCGLERP